MEPERWTAVELGPRPWHRRLAAIALVLAVAGAAFLVGRSTTPGTHDAETPPPTTSITSTVATTASGVAGVFAGQWEEHGLAMHIDPSGYGQIVFRTYKFCTEGPPPCDTIHEGEITNGGFADLTVAAASALHATGQIVTSTSPTQVPIGSFDVTYDSTADVLRLVFQGHAPVELCGPRARDPLSHCG